MTAAECAKCGTPFDTFPCHIKAANSKGILCQSCRPTREDRKKQVALSCAQCGTDFTLKACEVRYNKTGNFFCSRTCMGLWRTANWLGESHHNFKPKVTVSCAICGADKQVHESYAKMYGRFTCAAKECISAFKQSICNKGKDTRVSVPCDQCGSALKRFATSAYEKAFCNKRCRALWNSTNYRGKSNPNWKDGKSFDPYPVEWNHALREAVRERDGRCCRICGRAEASNKERLAVHHIDYNKENIAMDNLAATCHNCHVKTNGCRSYWTEWFLYHPAIVFKPHHFLT